MRYLRLQCDRLGSVAAGYFPKPCIAPESSCQNVVPPTTYPRKGRNRAMLPRLKRPRIEESIGQIGTCSICLYCSVSSAIESLIFWRLDMDLSPKRRC